ncbi:IclR family transcriptional regulator C-terminal domain-containing protein [Streptomyces caniscabiei]|uniref:IclR family transcriptional regulator domain-containing protein n=1 Tax=Streptomyces TaxID=1883 RepID=UPI0035287826
MGVLDGRRNSCRCRVLQQAGRHVGVGRRRRGRSAPRPRPSVRRLRPLLPYRADPLRAHTPATITDSATLRRSLAAVRRQGYAIVFPPGWCPTSEPRPTVCPAL